MKTVDGYVPPIVFDWVKFKGKNVFCSWNPQASNRAKRPMVDIHYCATQALNNIVLFTTQWNRNIFDPSELSVSKYKSWK